MWFKCAQVQLTLVTDLGIFQEASFAGMQNTRVMGSWMLPKESLGDQSVYNVVRVPVNRPHRVIHGAVGVKSKLQ
jgi:hypothetical protein